MLKDQVIGVLIFLCSAILAGIIIGYYWSGNELDNLLNVPLVIVFCAFVYVLLRILKRIMLREYPWWDWLYYPGLVAMMLPNFLATEELLSVYNMIADVGTTFLMTPLIFDAKSIFLKNKI